MSNPHAELFYKEFGPEKVRELLGEGVEYLEFTSGSFEVDMGHLEVAVWLMWKKQGEQRSETSYHIEGIWIASRYCGIWWI